jgi:chaperone required for assembly of F1-ATPase
MKRFYTNVSIGIPQRGLYSILLDGKPVKTPKRANLEVPWHGLAEAIAEEWKVQGPEIDPASMYLTKCANSAIDYTAHHEAAVAEGILAYANDLLCYRAMEPADLVARESEAWDPLLAWFRERYGVGLLTGTTVAPIRQEEEALAKLRGALTGLNAFVLTALHGAAALCGSLVLAMAVFEGRLTAEEAFAASRLNEDYQAEKWGRDAAAEARARFIMAELAAAARVLALAKAPV